jgi:hypothetical protein
MLIKPEILLQSFCDAHQECLRTGLLVHLSKEEKSERLAFYCEEGENRLNLTFNDFAVDLSYGAFKLLQHIKISLYKIPVAVTRELYFPDRMSVDIFSINEADCLKAGKVFLGQPPLDWEAHGKFTTGSQFPIKCGVWRLNRFEKFTHGYKMTVHYSPVRS